MKEYTVIEFAQKLGLTYRQVRYLVEQEKIKARKTDNDHYAIPASQLYKMRRKMRENGLQKSQNDI